MTSVTSTPRSLAESSGSRTTLRSEVPPALVPASEDRVRTLEAALLEAALVLPTQGPLASFVALNPLMNFEHLPFHEAVSFVRERLGAEGYLPESEYRELHAKGRIDDDDLAEALERARAAGQIERDLDLPPEISQAVVDSIVLRYPITRETPESLAWRAAERQFLARFRADVPADRARAMTTRTARFIRDALDLVGVETTMTEFAEKILGRLPTATAEEAPRASFFGIFGSAPKKPEAYLKRLGIPDGWQAKYLALVDARTSGRDKDAARLAYLEREWSRTSLALSRVGLEANLDAIRQALEEDPEALAVGTLFAHCANVTYEREPGPDSRIVERVGRDRTVGDLLATITGEHPSDLIDPVLIRFAAAYLDRGSASWAMPDRHRGFLASVRELLQYEVGRAARWQAQAADDLSRRFANADAATIVLAILDELGVAPEHYAVFLQRVLVELPGWAGLFHRFERRPHELPEGAPPISLLEYLALRLVLGRRAVLDVAKRHFGYTGPLRGLAPFLDKQVDLVRRPVDACSPLDAHLTLFQICQLGGLATPDVAKLGATTRARIVRRVDAFDEVRRRRVWHAAYEQHLYKRFLHALDEHRRRAKVEKVAPRFQIVVCMDDREESLRRHFEELSPDHETWGIAGFFGVALRFYGLDARQGEALCPIVVSPQHEVREVHVPEHEDVAELRKKRREAWARLRGRLVHDASRSTLGGTLLASTLGPAAVIPLFGRVLAPRLAHRLHESLSSKLIPSPKTLVTALRDTEDESADQSLGFTTEEAAARVYATLENMGMRHFGRIVAFVGHGSSSVNNPHLAVYDCGACGARRGGPNARAFAHFANDPEVRAALRQRGIDIPATSYFVGAEHDTASDAIVYYDLDDMPEEFRGEFEAFRAAIGTTAMRSAHERCRRFASAPKNPTPEQALRHVQSRAVDLAEPRFELGHQGVAVAVIGRRDLTKHLFLDRRSFFLSYDPTTDPTGEILERILMAAGPVGAGISLQYFFSRVDNRRYGAGPKLAHNIVSMVGVLEGVASDLRTGLPWQGVEVHEPVRLLLVCEKDPACIAAIYERREVIRHLVGNEWIRLVALDPESGEMFAFDPTRGFEKYAPKGEPLPHAKDSMTWYAGKGPDYLPFALLGSTVAQAAATSASPEENGHA